MAATAIQQELKCSICLNVYSAPTTLPCGHTFCKKCIQTTIQTGCQSSCPECRFQLSPSTRLNRNTKMCSIIEHLTKSKSSKTQGGCSYCDKAAEKLCLDCETPLCCDHLKKHKDSVGHVLTDLGTTLHTRKCPIHQELLRYYCTEESVNICASCGLIGDHKHHKIEKLSDLSDMRKSTLKMLECLLTKKKVETEKKFALVESHVENIVKNTALIRDSVTGLIRDMKKELETLEHHMLCQISNQEDHVLSQLSQVKKSLEGQILEINNHIKEIQTLCTTDDPLTLLERQASNSPKANALINAENNFYVKHLDFGSIFVLLRSSIRRFTKSLPVLLKNHGFHTEDSTSRLLPLSQITKNIPPFLVLILDGQTVGSPHFALSESTFCSGQHYWEVETSDKPCWAVMLSYRGKDCNTLGYTADSWCFQLANDKQYKAVHDSQELIVATNGPVKTLGVYLEYELGTISFYQVSKCVKHLCSMHAKFSQPLYIAMFVEQSGCIRIRK